MRQRRKIQIGERFGRLKVISEGPQIKQYGVTRRTMICDCECGNNGIIIANKDLMCGRKKSCGHCDTNKRLPRLLNGYRVIYKPFWASSMKGKNYKGYVYEHRFVVESHLGRILSENECVHHKDFDPLNNTIGNLLVLTRTMHSALHMMLKLGELKHEEYKTMDEEEIKDRITAYIHKQKVCIDCGRKLACYSKGMRCVKCAHQKQKKPITASKEELKRQVSESSMSAVAKHYNVSFRTLKKRISAYGVSSKIGECP